MLWPVQTESANDQRAEGLRHFDEDDRSHNAQLLPKHFANSCSRKNHVIRSLQGEGLNNKPDMASDCKSYTLFKVIWTMCTRHVKCNESQSSRSCKIHRSAFEMAEALSAQAKLSLAVKCDAWLVPIHCDDKAALQFLPRSSCHTLAAKSMCPHELQPTAPARNQRQ